jgi:CubicO group peptidase (beta-lactamase class C family)
MTRDTRHDLRSVSKSVVSALVGIALSEGAIGSVDRPVLDWFPEFGELDTPERRRITLAHVLGMTAGLEWNEDMPYTDPRHDEIRMTRDLRPLHYVLSRPVVAAPGERFNYNGGLTQVLAAVVQRATGVPLSEYARRKLFAPLGISEVEWLGNLDGLPAAASGLRLRARDLAKIGSLYLHHGRWNGLAVLSAEWVERSTRRQFAFASRPGAARRSDAGYAWQWWYSCLHTPAGPIEARIAVGNGMQRVIVLPGLDLVVTMFAGRYNDFADSMALASRILREQVIPAVTSGVTTGCPGV